MRLLVPCSLKVFVNNYIELILVWHVLFFTTVHFRVISVVSLTLKTRTLFSRGSTVAAGFESTHNSMAKEEEECGADEVRPLPLKVHLHIRGIEGYDSAHFRLSRLSP